MHAMHAMPRRRSRVALVFSVIFVFLLYRALQSSNWGIMDPRNLPVSHDVEIFDGTQQKSNPEDGDTRTEITQDDLLVVAKPQSNYPKPKPQPIETEVPKKGGIPKPKPADPHAKPNPALHDPEETTTAFKNPAHGIHAQNPPGRLPDANLEKPKPSKKPQVHWSKPPEHFPVPTESIIPLPTGVPKTFPNIQAVEFKPESPEDKDKREKRLARVKAEAERSWSAYRKYAWLHDELAPVSLNPRDPFCGWAATLVDSMDTLWIMGLRDEFDEAARAVEGLDFTYSSTRRDIPVFETTIRYLGGLLAAYDVSGGRGSRYPILLDKAIELAEILMGIFDTPNRMPLLYYNWLPEYASQPHRAQHGGMAELASLSMEFTRLAQFTGEDKYYDAIARITNALKDLQDRGTAIDGLFPENLDLSGCNMTATIELEKSQEAQKQIAENPQTTEPVGYVPGMATPKDTTGKKAESDEDLPRGEAFEPAGPDGTSSEVKVDTEKSEEGLPRGEAFEPAEPPSIPGRQLPRRQVARDQDSSIIQKQTGPVGANGKPAIRECVPQGLEPSGHYQSYSMGGAQDSAYEYFPKEDLLLGGLNPQYKELHINTVEAMKKWLLYRPMIPDDRNLLFSAKITTGGDPKTDARTQYEVTHLTCFVGGMFGIGSRMYERPDDLEIAKKLTDGCVWAYETMPTGIMPESADMLQCESREHCEWNETRWHEVLDPQAGYRNQLVKDWEEKQARLKTENESLELRKQEEQRQKAEMAAVQAEQPKEMFNDAIGAASPAPPAHSDAVEAPEMDAEEIAKLRAGDAVPQEPKLNKRAPFPPPGDHRLPGQDPRQRKKQNGKAGYIGAVDKPKPVEHGEEAAEAILAEEGSVSGSRPSRSPEDVIRGETQPEPEPVKPAAEPKPMSHEEFVKTRIEEDGLRPGFTRIGGRNYILRPEAIESVWYMYRITGDPIWQEKGWKMFEAIMKVTRTDVANSAISDVLDPESSQNDSMESFWLAETLKYFYLLYSEPDVISLDEWVLNTEAHPFRRPK